MADINPVVQIFEEAQEAFREKLKDPQVYSKLLGTRSVADVHKAAVELQKRVEGKGGLRFLKKIDRFLKKLAFFSAVTEQFVQVEPELLALIWGPIKLLILWSSEFNKAFDLVTDAMVRIGQVLPQFDVLLESAITRGINDRTKAALALFYEDLLDFFQTMFDIFKVKRWQHVFHTLWRGRSQQIDVVVQNLEKHANLVREEVTVTEIQEAREDRIRSLEYFATAKNYQETQKFLGLKARIAPELYDAQLDDFHKKAVTDCAKWLPKDTKFSEWSDPSHKAVTWLWLQGIPGSGKTYLSAAAVDHLREEARRTLFVFMSYSNRAKATTLSVIQSLIFQAADDDVELQAALVTTKERALQGDTGHATKILKTFLETASGPTYIVIDGLDEMEKVEREILLQKLDEISRGPEDLRVLISSRIEADILLALSQKAKTIRVDDKNYGGIQLYVDHRCSKWMAVRELDPITKQKVREVVAPLSTIARGMFLYARIFLDSLEQMTSIDEIQRELNTPPENYKDAYHRLFQRINKADGEARNKGRKVLGWIECAPIPMTVFEMEQALAVDADPDRELTSVPQPLGKLDFVQMCGPLVEVVGEKLQFVHFTVSEYLFSRHISDSISRTLATKDLAACFLAYLSSGVLDPELDFEEIDKNIIAGHYRLFQYATFYWPALLPSKERLNGSRTLIKLLKRVAEHGRNDEFTTDVDNLESFYENEDLQAKFPEVYDMLCATLSFRQDERRWEWQWTNSLTWADRDPLTTSRMLVRIQERFRILVSNPALEGTIRYYYGSRIYKCSYPICAHSRRGFKEQRDLAAHFMNHGRPYKCSLPSCEWCSLGFNSRSNRDNHWVKYHLPSASQLRESSENFDNLGPEDAQPMLFLLITEQDVEKIKQLLVSPGGKQLKNEVLSAARRFAASKVQSLAVTEVLTPANERHLPLEILTAAAQGGSIEFVRWALAKGRPSDCGKLIREMLGTESDEIYALWEEYVLEKLNGTAHDNRIPAHSEGRWTMQGLHARVKEWSESMLKIEGLFKQPLWSSAANSALREERAKALLGKLKRYLSPGLLGSILVQIAKSNCSIPLAEEVLKLGAPINYPWGWNRGMSAMQVVAKETTEEAAHFMRFLLFRGADVTNEDKYKRDIRKEKGVAKIETWLGVTWDELLGEYRQSKAGGQQRTCLPILT